jgi:hypothetical protein
MSPWFFSYFSCFYIAIYASVGTDTSFSFLWWSFEWVSSSCDF